MWWIIGVGVTIGSLIAFRVGYLDMLDVWDRKGRSRAVLDREPSPSLMGFVYAISWPILLLGVILKKIIFPRGIESRYAREKRLAAIRAEQAANRAATVKEANRILAEQGFAPLPHFEYEVTTQYPATDHHVQELRERISRSIDWNINHE